MALSFLVFKLPTDFGDLYKPYNISQDLEKINPNIVKQKELANPMK